jgi:hypothetical protein
MPSGPVAIRRSETIALKLTPTMKYYMQQSRRAATVD